MDSMRRGFMAVLINRLLFWAIIRAGIAVFLGILLVGAIATRILAIITVFIAVLLDQAMSTRKWLVMALSVVVLLGWPDGISFLYEIIELCTRSTIEVGL